MSDSGPNSPPKTVQTKWEEFVVQYNFIMKFGADRLQEILNARAKEKGENYRFTPKQVEELLPEIRGKMELDLEKALDNSLGLVQKGMQQQQTPRGDESPDYKNAITLGIEPGLVKRRVQQFEQAPWADKFDKAADTSIRKDFDDMIKAVDPNAPKNEVVNQYKMKLKMNMANRLEAKLRLEGPKLTATIKPKRPGEQ
jgi:hypothetical protein